MSEELEQPKLFKLLDDFIIAEKLMQSLEKKTASPAFEQKIRASFLQINSLIDIELHKICDNAPTIEENEDGTSEATSGSL